jgi:hypothetical protein
MSVGAIISILTLLGTLASAGYAVWRKYWSPEAELARLKAQRAAAEAAVKVEAERLQATYARIDKETPNEAEGLDRLNRPLK